MPNRSMLLAVLFAVLALPAAAPAAVRGASVSLTECAPSLSRAERTAVFEGRMRAARPGQRLQMRFSLQTRAEPGPWQRLALAGWDEWVTADPDVGRYVYEKRVENLDAPAAYRAVVRFRWTTVLGQVVRVVRLASEPCRQPDMRPDLVAGRIVLSEGRYLVPVRNAGRTDAGPFEVVLTVDGQRQPAEPVMGVAAGDRRVLSLAGPRCAPGGVVAVALDTGETVDERDELSNTVSERCSAARG
jgi:hypothetical protein